MSRVWIKSITYNNSCRLEFCENDIVVFVGPNNAGKSASLKEAAALLRSTTNKGKVISEISIGKQGDDIDLIATLSSIGQKYNSGNPMPSYKGFGFNIYEGNAKSYWNNTEQSGLSELSNLFIKNISTEDRLQAANPTQNIKLTQEPPHHPIHFLQKKDTLELKFSGYFRQAFGTDLIVHRNAGNEVPLYVGERPKPEDGEDRVSEGYLAKLEALDLLHEQGDGMRSFVGVLLNAFISHHSVLFIDEPEAFLHPPQARLLGHMLAKDLPTERQLFLATHSGDFLKGVLDSNAPNLKIIRIRRDGSLNKICALNNHDIEEIWNDSLLRHSNVLEGLFHTKVVICESDSDCRFYSATLTAMCEQKDIQSPDILFIHCGGKHRIPTVIKALRKLEVPMQIITDFDILSSKNPLQNMVEALGEKWSEFEVDWRTVKTSIDQKRPELESRDVIDDIKDILGKVTDNIFPQESKKQIEKTLKKTSAWAQAKEIGKTYIPSGNARTAYDRIQSKLEKLGILIVEVGELEGFVKSVGNHGPKWVSDVLSMDLANDTELEEARKFLNKLIS